MKNRIEIRLAHLVYALHGLTPEGIAIAEGKKGMKICTDCDNIFKVVMRSIRRYGNA